MIRKSLKSIVKNGSNWKHKKTGKVVIVLKTPLSKYEKVKLLHGSGRVTTKEQHYFLYDYGKI